MASALTSRRLEMQAKAILERLEDSIAVRPITIYDQFGRPIFTPVTVRGEKVIVRRPTRFSKA